MKQNMDEIMKYMKQNMEKNTKRWKKILIKRWNNKWLGSYRP